jgi:hypothetical protein
MPTTARKGSKAEGSEISKSKENQRRIKCLAKGFSVI